MGSAPLADAEAIWRELDDGMRMHPEPQAVAVDGAIVVVRYIERGCFDGSFRGLPGMKPTGRSYQVIAIKWFELEHGSIAKRWGARDFGSIKDQVLGAS